MRRLLPVLAAALLLGACSPQAAPPSSAPPTTAPPPTVTPSPSPAPQGLLLRLDYVGGFIAPTASLTSLPAVAIYTDGTVIEPGVTPAIYPGPAIPALQAATLTPAGLAAVIAEAKAAGLDGPDRHLVGAPAPDTASARFTFVADGQTHVTTATSLRGGDGADGTAIAALATLVDELGALESPTAPGIGPWTPYVATAMRLLVTAGAPEGDPAQHPVAWPLPSALAAFGDELPAEGGSGGLNPGAGTARCGVVTGPDLATLRPLLEAANTLTPWTSEGASFGIAVRPLLPDESGCF